MKILLIEPAKEAMETLNCDICEEVFFNNDDLDKNMKIHFNPECNICNIKNLPSSATASTEKSSAASL